MLLKLIFRVDDEIIPYTGFEFLKKFMNKGSVNQQ